MSKTIKLEGIITEIRREYGTRRAGYSGEHQMIETYGWMAKVVFSRGVLRSGPIEIPIQEGDADVRDIVEIEMSFRKPKK